LSPAELAIAADGVVDDDAALQVRRFDFRRPSKFGREHVRVLEVAHETFARRFASGLGGALRGLVQLEPIAIDQLSYNDYIRSMPNPNVLAVVDLPPLPGAAVLEMNVQLALQLVDRLLGGRGVPVELRRPTEVEAFLLRDVMQIGVNAVGETLAPLLEAQPHLGTVEFNPQLVQVAAPSDMVLLLTFRLSVSQGAQTEGLVTLCYPSSTLAPVLDRLVTQLAPGAAGDGEGPDLAALELLTSHLRETTTEIAARLAPTTLTAGELAALTVGDVIRFEHRADEPVRACVGDTTLLDGHLGRRGRRLALQVRQWHVERDDIPAS
jgi:flagellar motor switch protein FliM